MLFLSGRIRTPGRVDEGTAQTDYLDVERQRGITVRTAATALPWKGCCINLVDTPGHTDFVAEVERSLRVLDGAVLIISAVEGVQAHTETLWHALRASGTPTLIFINKVDRFGAAPERTLAQVRRMLTERAVPVQQLPPVEREFQGAAPRPDRELLEELAEWDEPSLQLYVDGDQSGVHRRLAELTRTGQAVPVLFGASLRGLGVAGLMDAVLAYLPGPDPAAPLDAEPSGVVFKVETDPVMGRVAYVRLFAGTLHARQPVRLAGRAEPTKAARIRRMYARHHEDLACLQAGDIGVLCGGLGAVRAGDIFGDDSFLPPAQRLARPVLSVGVIPERPQDLQRLLTAVQTLAEEDPSMQVRWVPEVRELTITVVGPVQVEIVQSLLVGRFGLAARFTPPSVVYRETPVGVAEAEVLHRPPGGWAWLRMRVEPGERGSGLTYVPLNRHDDLYPQFEAEVRRSVESTLERGLQGWQVTDIRVTLLGGAFDSIMTTVGDYTGATQLVLREALAKAGTSLLEPLYAFTMSVPDVAAGKVAAELGQRRAVTREVTADGDRICFTGTIPVAESLELPARLTGLSGGRGIFSATPAGYQPAPAPGPGALRAKAAAL